MIYAEIATSKNGYTIFFHGRGSDEMYEKIEKDHQKYFEKYPFDEGVNGAVVFDILAENDFIPVSENFFYKK